MTNIDDTLQRAGPAMADDLPTDIQTPQRTPASKRGVGRPKGQSADKTRDAILNAAEDLFAANGFDGTSLRDVARASGVQIAAIGYHFGPKDALFDTVIQRRAEVMSDQRARDLDRLTAEHGTTPIPLADLVRAYVRPFIASASHGDPGWRTYAALMGRLANSPLGTEVIARHYDKTARAYLDAFQRALPNVPETRVIDGFTFMVASMLALCASTGRAERLSTEDHPPHDVGDTLNPLTAFLVAGFEALADTETTVTTQDDTR